MERTLKPERLVQENIRSLLEARRLDATALAVWCGHEAGWISKILRGENSVRLKDLGRVADFFGLTVSELFQHGISSKTERRRQHRRKKDRRAHERRMARDRRTPDELKTQGFKSDLRPSLMRPMAHDGDGEGRPPKLSIVEPT